MAALFWQSCQNATHLTEVVDTNAAWNVCYTANILFKVLLKGGTGSRATQEDAYVWVVTCLERQLLHCGQCKRKRMNSGIRSPPPPLYKTLRMSHYSTVWPLLPETASKSSVALTIATTDCRLNLNNAVPVTEAANTTSANRLNERNECETVTSLVCTPTSKGFV